MKLRAAVVGLGFIGLNHIDALKRATMADLIAVSDANEALMEKVAQDYSVLRSYGNIDDLLKDEEIDVVHNCTPNNMHLKINEKIIRAKKHVFSEKPLGMNSSETSEMLKLLDCRPDLVHGINFNYRMNPLVQEMKHMIKNGEIGIPRLVHGSYLQDWLLFDTDYNWRLEPEINGPSRAVADIGSHWMDCIMEVTAGKITGVCADLHTVIPVRKKFKADTRTFTQDFEGVFEEKEVKTEDYGAVMFKMDNGIRGVFYVSQVSAGRKGYLDFEVNGSKASLHWNQESPDQMWMGYRDRYNSQIIRNPALMTKYAGVYATLPPGHPEGWSDALKNNIKSFYKYISEGKRISKDPADFATFHNGHYIMKIIDSILESNRSGRWIEV